MSKEKQHNILIASILKPIDDHRLNAKWGNYFLTKQNKSVHIFGLCNNPNSLNNTHKSLNKNSLKKRLKAIFNYYKLLKSLKPRIVIITTFELLFVSFLYSKFNKQTSFFYDVSENYGLNMTDQGNYSKWNSLLANKIISLNESFAAKFIEHYFYTEAIYHKQLTFLQHSNSTLIENLYSTSVNIEQKKHPDITFLITGTISNSYGLKTGLEWFKKIKNIIPSARLKIVGHSTTDIDIKESEHIAANISDTPLSHRAILQEISDADCILMPYKWSESFYGCTPTKLHEALTLKTPIIITASNHLNRFQCNAIHQINQPSDLNKKSLDKLLSSDFPEVSLFESYYKSLDTIFSPYLLE